MIKEELTSIKEMIAFDPRPIEHANCINEKIVDKLFSHIDELDKEIVRLNKELDLEKALRANILSDIRKSSIRISEIMNLLECDF